MSRAALVCAYSLPFHLLLSFIFIQVGISHLLFPFYDLGFYLGCSLGFLIVGFECMDVCVAKCCSSFAYRVVCVSIVFAILMELCLPNELARIRPATVYFLL